MHTFFWKILCPLLKTVKIHISYLLMKPADLDKLCFSSTRWFLFVCLIWFFRSYWLNIFQLCRDGSSWVEPVLSKDKCVLLKATTQWRRRGSMPRPPWSLVKHSTTDPLCSIPQDEPVSIIKLHCWKNTHNSKPIRFFSVLTLYLLNSTEDEILSAHKS